MSAISCINNKNSISYMFCILCIFIWIFTLSTAQLQRAAWTSWRLANESRELVYTKHMHKKPYANIQNICKISAKNMHNMQRICTTCNKYAKYMQNRTSLCWMPLVASWNPTLPLVTVSAWLFAKNMQKICKICNKYAKYMQEKCKKNAKKCIKCAKNVHSMQK